MIKTSGLSAAAVLIVAIVGGATGAALALAGNDGEPAPRGLVVGDSTGVAESSPIATLAPTLGSEAPSAAPAAQEDAVTTPVKPAAPAVDAPVKTPAPADRAEEAASRAEKAAEKAENAADRAEESAPEATPAASEAPHAAPKWAADGSPYLSPGLECRGQNDDGTYRPIPGEHGTTWYCVKGKFQREDPNPATHPADEPILPPQ